MLINKENDKKLHVPKKEGGHTDTAHMDVQCHLIIKDKDTKKVLVNKRG